MVGFSVTNKQNIQNNLKTSNEFISAVAYILGKQHFGRHKKINFFEP